jgi:hypothetical protein
MKSIYTKTQQMEREYMTPPLTMGLEFWARQRYFNADPSEEILTAFTYQNAVLTAAN